MAERNLLCIEPDSGTVAEIRRALSPYGFGVENIPNGEEAIEWGRSHPISLIILSVEPRKVGYAICNKLKRSPSLREIPLILISSEETQATFEQHKKLKAHADEYLLKPLDVADLLLKVNRLIPLGEALPVEEIHEADSGDIILADEELAGLRAHHHASDGHEDVPTAVARSAEGSADGIEAADDEPRSDTDQQSVVDNPEPSPFQGETFDSETQAAFAALEAGATEGGSTHRGGSAEGMVDLRSLWSDDDLPASMGWEAPPPTIATPVDPDIFRSGNTLGPDLEPAPSSEPHQMTAPDLPVVRDAVFGVADSSFGESLDVPPSPEEVEQEDSLENETRLAMAAAARDVGRVRELEGRGRELEGQVGELQARIGSLESERQTLRRELEEARERFNQSATFSK